MAPTKKSAGEAPRRSRRIASKEPEELGLPARVRKLPRKGTRTQTNAFDVGRAIERINRGNAALYTQSLTFTERIVVIAGMAKAATTAQERIAELEAQNATLRRRKHTLAGAAFQRQLEAKMLELDSVPAPSSSAAAPSSPAATTPVATSSAAPPPAPISPPSFAATAIISPAQASTTPALPLWRRIGSLAARLTPFKLPLPQIAGSKRATEEEPSRAAKRQKSASPPPASPSIPSPSPAQVTPAASTTPSPPPRAAEMTKSKKRPAPQDDDADDTDDHVNADARPKTAVTTPRRFLCPSTKNGRIPTSLSTVTEYTETSILESTPSKPSTMPTSSKLPSLTRPAGYIPSTANLSTITSIPSIALSAPSPFPLKRRSALVSRANRLGTPRPAPQHAWERSITGTPRPAEPNADARHSKLERMRRLEQELEALKKDEDIIEMESHRRKRVKVDQLEYIPHNLPGDPSGMFRVPDWDSDDEMEVELSVPERKNVFAVAEEFVQREVRQEEGVQVGQEMVQQDGQDEHDGYDGQEAVETSHEPLFAFPDVGRRTEPPVPTWEAEALGAQFSAGFESWRAERGMV